MAAACFSVSAADTTFIVRYWPAARGAPRDRHCMTMLLEDEVEGWRRVSRDRPRCPVLHCRSPVWRRPTHRRHHVWLQTGRTRHKLSLSVRPLVQALALLSKVKSAHGDKYHHATDHTFPAILLVVLMTRGLELFVIEIMFEGTTHRG
jgi:hypothetical protein